MIVTVPQRTGMYPLSVTQISGPVSAEKYGIKFGLTGSKFAYK